MFDIGFAELLLVGVVGLLVIGPERLPGAIRTTTAWVSRFRRGFDEVRAEVQRELHNDSVMRELKESSDSIKRDIEHATANIKNDVAQMQEGLSEPLNSAKALLDVSVQSEDSNRTSPLSGSKNLTVETASEATTTEPDATTISPHTSAPSANK